MIISIDYDETYTLDPDMWDKAIWVFHDYGHKVYIVTYRHETLDKIPEPKGLKIIYTDGKAKKPFCEALGIKIDVWIEDNPKAVYEDSAWKHDSPELAAWRLEQRERADKAP